MIYTARCHSLVLIFHFIEVWSAYFEPEICYSHIEQYCLVFNRFIRRGALTI